MRACGPSEGLVEVHAVEIHILLGNILAILRLLLLLVHQETPATMVNEIIGDQDQSHRTDLVDKPVQRGIAHQR